MNLAASFARAQRRTLLVSADMRGPGRADIASASGGTLRTIDARPTLSAILVGAADVEDVDRHVPLMDNLWLVPAGNGASSISLADLDVNVLIAAVDSMRALYDAVVIIGPAITLYPDTPLLARVSDGLLLAATARVTHASDVSAASRLIRQVGGRVLGAVLTEGPTRTGGPPPASVTSVLPNLDRGARLDIAASGGHPSSPHRNGTSAGGHYRNALRGERLR